VDCRAAECLALHFWDEADDGVFWMLDHEGPRDSSSAVVSATSVPIATRLQ